MRDCRGDHGGARLLRGDDIGGGINGSHSRISGGKVERSDGGGALGERVGPRSAEESLRSIGAVERLRVEEGLLVLRVATLGRRARGRSGDEVNAGDGGVDVDGDRIGCDRVGRSRDVGDGVRQALRRRQRIGVVAVGVVGDAAAAVAVPGAGADAAIWRDVDQLIVGGAVAD